MFFHFPQKTMEQARFDPGTRVLTSILHNSLRGFCFVGLKSAGNRKLAGTSHCIGFARSLADLAAYNRQPEPGAGVGCSTFKKSESRFCPT